VLKDRTLCLAGVAALVAYLFMPFSYRNALAQLESGASLRFALNAFAVGAVVATLLLRRVWVPAAALLAVAAAFALYREFGIFWIDPQTHGALVAAAACALAVAFVRSPPASLVTGVVAAMLIVSANTAAARHAVARYDELLQPRGSHFFEWLAVARPARVVVDDVPAGAVMVVSPTTRVYDVLDPVPCDEARTLAAELALANVPPPEKTVFPSALRQVERCGPAVYADAAVRVLHPAR
jgi:hypothetical protein